MDSHCAPPILKSFSEITPNLSKILDWTVDRTDDYIYHFPCPEVGYDMKKLATLEFPNTCIAGSAALSKIYDLLFPTSKKKWTASDVDIFLLGQDENARVPIGMTDIVKCKEGSVVTLLINFDMPICRVAYNFNYEIWISAQCIAALFTRRQNMPAYLKNTSTFFQVLEKNQPAGSEQPDANNRNTFLYKRLAERVKKYQGRGFGVNWIKTDTILPWIKNRFYYAEWNL